MIEFPVILPKFCENLRLVFQEHRTKHRDRSQTSPLEARRTKFPNRMKAIKFTQERMQLRERPDSRIYLKFLQYWSFNPPFLCLSVADSSSSFQWQRLPLLPHPKLPFDRTLNLKSKIHRKHLLNIGLSGKAVYCNKTPG